MFRLDEHLDRIYIRTPPALPNVLSTNILHFQALPALPRLLSLTRPTSLLRALGGSDSDYATIDEHRQCWICLATDEELPNAYWLHPCRCRGSNKWVHEFCLSRWIDEKQLGNMDLAVLCTQCRTEYIIVVPPAGRLDGAIECIDKHYERLCPTMVVGMILTTIYFSAVTYGAVTVLQVIGYEKGMHLLNEGYPPLLLIGLPAIPVVLLFGRMINWDDAILRLLRSKNRRSHQRRRAQRRRQQRINDNSTNNNNNNGAVVNDGVVVTENDVNNELPTGATLEEEYYDYLERENSALDAMQQGDNHSAERIMRASRNFVGALILPTCSVLVGRMLYESFESPWQRAFLGGFTFIVVKGCATIYLRQCKFMRKRDRQVLDYTEQNVRRYRRHY